MEKLRQKLFFIVFITVVAIGSQFLTACESSTPQTEVAIEDTLGGVDFLNREFGECDESITATDPYNQEFKYVYQRTGETIEQRIVEDNFPHDYSSEDKKFPLRGSWRKTKAEIMDIVNRQIHSTSVGGQVPLLHYFDMVLLINAADHDENVPENSSAQRMQVYVRNGDSNEIKNWTRSKVWRVSTGRPCGQKIATPTGVFKLDPTVDLSNPGNSRFSSNYYSRQFDDIQMYETMFMFHNYQNGALTGVAIHGTYKTSHLGRQDSGGCIRLHRKNSKCLYDTFAGNLSSTCIPGSKLDYWGQVPSLMNNGGEADPEIRSNGSMEIGGYKVLVAIFNDKEDTL